MTPRERYEQAERELLSERAMLASHSKGREREETPCPYRTAFQRDRDRILHSKSFRRLKHKTQVFLAPEGDHYRTRLTHSLEVSQIARTIARALRLNEDLTEAVALGHDVGHTPFGHAGERALNDVMEGGFHHYEQSVRVVEKLENEGEGLNLTYEVRNGILCHTKGTPAETLEGRIVRIADKVAYVSHDMDDAIRAGILKETDIPIEIRSYLGEDRSARFDAIIGSLVENSVDDICMDEKTNDFFFRLHSFMYDSLYFNPAAKSEEGKVEVLIKRLFTYFLEHADQLPKEYLKIREEEGLSRAVCDYIAGMTDNYALEIYRSLFIPTSWVMK